MKITDIEMWYDYATFDEDGFVNGIKEDAPEEAKQAYDRCVKAQQEFKKRGLKLMFRKLMPIFLLFALN